MFYSWVSNLILVSTKSFIHGESLSSNVTYLFGMKFEKMFISVSLKMDTCL